MSPDKILKIAKRFEAFAKTKKWIPDDLKEGRFKGWTMAKMKREYNRLKKKEDKSKEETSKMRALALGIRFKGGDVPGGKKSKGL
jgi:hypothetical protein